MQITLINPSTGDKKITSFKYPPMGLLALGAYIEKAGHKVQLIDENMGDEKEVTGDIVGISAMSVNIHRAFELARKLKPRTIILGGIHPTVMPQHTLSEPAVDAVIQGEGELSFMDILNNGITKRLYEKRELIKDLDTLPMPLYRLLDLKKYKSPYARRIPFVSMVRSRGCPFACTFCGNPKMYGRTFRCQSPGRTIEEIDYLVKELGVKEISFKDTELTLDVRLPELCELMIAKKYDLIWSCNGRVSNVNRELLKLMRKAGCYAITFGIESGNAQILNLMKKQITLGQAYWGCRLAKEAGLQVVTNFMIGNRGDTKQTITETINFAKKLPSDYAYFGFATPFPGTELREEAEKNNWILDKSFDAIRYDEPMMNATDMSLDELKPYLKKAYHSYYFRPGFILNKLFNFAEYSNYWDGIKKII
jgi:anaerobic magnesium-protoporphyrin IX monomethyl ester cyclase